MRITPEQWRKIWTKVDMEGPQVPYVKGRCQVWEGAKKSGGYGYIRLVVEGKSIKFLLHRIVWEFKHGEIPAGKFILHRCDNRACIRDEHLFVGTNVENIKDMWKKGRGVTGENSPGAKLTERQVQEIHRLLRAGIWVAHIAQNYGLNYNTIYRIAKGEQWKSVGIITVKQRKNGPGVRCTVVEGEPPQSCTYKAAVKVTTKDGVRHLCSRHGLPVVLAGGNLKVEAL